MLFRSTVLTLLPLLKKLDKGFAGQGIDGMTTVLMCSAIYGSAIGGMGSMIGSPANALLLGMLDFYQIPGREQITFFNWFLWSVPLVVVFVLIAWGVVAGLGLPAKARGVVVHVDCLDEVCETTGRQRYGSFLFWLYMGFWVLEALARQIIPGFVAVSPLVSSGFFILFLYLTFGRPAPESMFGSGPLLKIGGLLNGVPRRGFLFILALVAIFWAVHSLGIDEMVVVRAGEIGRAHV